MMFTFLTTDSLVNPTLHLIEAKMQKEEQIHLPRKTRVEKCGLHNLNEEKKKEQKAKTWLDDSNAKDSS